MINVSLIKSIKRSIFMELAVNVVKSDKSDNTCFISKDILDTLQCY